MAKKKSLGKGLDAIFGENVGSLIEEISSNDKDFSINKK